MEQVTFTILNFESCGCVIVELSLYMFVCFIFQGEVELSIPRFNVDFPTVLCRAPYSWYIKSKDYIIAKLSVWYHSVDTAICLYVDQ